MTKDELEQIRQTVADLLANARKNICVAEDYEKMAMGPILSAHFVLHSVGIDISTEALRAKLAMRPGMFTGEDYAKALVDELFGSEVRDA